MNLKKNFLILVNLLCTIILFSARLIPCPTAEPKAVSGNENILTVSAYDYDGSYGGAYNGSSSSLDDFSDLSFSDLEDLFSGYSVSGIMNDLIKVMGDAATTYFIILLIISALWCFLGYRIYPVFVAIESFLWSLSIGTIITLFSESAIWLLVFPVAGVILAILCVKFESLGAFLIGLVNCWFIPTLISIVLTESFKNGLIIGTIIAVICGIITAIFKKPIIIIGSVLNYGPMAGLALACLMVKTEWSLPLQILFVVAGFFVQTKTNNGLLERGSLITYLKNQFASKPRVEAGALEWTTPAAPTDAILPEATESSEHIASAADVAVTAASVQVCPHCDTRNQADDAFCYCCGYPLRAKEKSDAADLTIPTPSPVDATVPEVPVIAVERKIETPADRPASAVAASVSSGGKLKFSGFSSERSDSSGSVVIKMGGETKSKTSKTETVTENRSLSTFKTTNDFDDE